MALPKHYSQCDIVKPFQAPYYANQFGTRSIGEPDWRPHVSNALSHPHCQQHSIKGGDGLDKFSKIRCPELVTTTVEGNRSPTVTEEQRPSSTPKVIDIRNGIGEAADGDKTYYIPEYSQNFHRQGSTLPIANFGGSSRTVPDTFIPLVKLPMNPRRPFRDIERKKEKVAEIDEVRQLDFWKPAEQLKYP